MRSLARATVIAGVIVISSFFFYVSFFKLSYNPLQSIGVINDSKNATDDKIAVGGKVVLDNGEEDWPTPGDKIIVMAKMKSENTDWVAENLPDWQHAIYHMDDPEHDGLHPPINKGREAMAYLTYLIDNYDSLPATIAFLHSHRDGWPGGWHTDAPDNDNVFAIQDLRLDYVQQEGYANMRCMWVPGCPDEVKPFRHQSKGGEAEYAMAEAWHFMFGNSSQVPETIGAACCSQFAVSKDQVRKRPLKDYVRFREWLIQTDLDDNVSGRVLEYLWHIFFGKDPVQ